MHEIWALVNEMSPYLLLGFAFAGLLHSFVPASLYRRYLGKNSFSSVIWAALLGVPLPLCSCGVRDTYGHVAEERRGLERCHHLVPDRHATNGCRFHLGHRLVSGSPLIWC